jgi:hypothetical protein
MEKSVAELKSRFIQFGHGEPYTGEVEVDEDGIKKYPQWVLQPYVRSKIPPNPEKSKEKGESAEDKENTENKDAELQKGETSVKSEKKRENIEPDRKELSKKRKPCLGNHEPVNLTLLKLARKFNACPGCSNTSSQNCSLGLCKSCCRGRVENPLECQTIDEKLSNDEFICITHRSRPPKVLKNE